MARITDIGLSGSVGPLVFYKNQYGTPCSRARPAHVRLSKGSRETAQLFGIASSMSAMIRRELVSLLPPEKDLKIMYRLNTVLLEWLKAGLPQDNGLVTRLQHIDWYPFISGCAVHSNMRSLPVIHWENPGTVVVGLPRLRPAIQISAPQLTESIRVHIKVLSCRVSSPSGIGGSRESFIDIPYTDAVVEARDIPLPLTIKPGELALVVLGLKYTVVNEGNRELAIKKDWQPLDIMGAAYLPVNE